MPKGKKIEPLDLQELENNPSLNGMLAHLEPLPSPSAYKFRSADISKPIGTKPIGLEVVDPEGRSNRKHEDIPETQEPIDFTPIGANPVAESPVDMGPIATAPAGGASLLDLDDVLAELATGPQPSRSRGRVVPATRVEHGHSATQDTLYWYLWRAGKAIKGSRSHFVQAGYGQIQAGIGVDRSNVQDAIRELQKKLAIRVIKANTVGSATVYEVFCCEDILAKRREAKLVWARTYGKRRVDLITEAETTLEENAFMPTGLTPTGSAPRTNFPIDVTESVGVNPTASIGFTPIEGVGVTPIQEVNKAIKKVETTSELTKLREFLEQQIGLIDEEAAKKLFLACQAKAGSNTVTVEQIISIVRAKLVIARNARNPVGFLIEAVPKHFPLSNQMRRAAGTDESTTEREYWERIIASPDAPETLKEEAKRLLA